MEKPIFTCFFTLAVIIVTMISIRPVISQSDVSWNQWRKIELESFSFLVPVEMQSREGKGIDSAIWKFGNDSIEITIDLGRYSGKSSVYKDEQNYRESHVRIDGKKVTMVFFRSSEPLDAVRPYVVAAYFSNIDSNRTKLSFFATCTSPRQQQVAQKIFKSVKFK